MPADPRRVKELFVAAIDLPNPEARAAFLGRECGPDNELRQRVDRLLAAHDAAPPSAPEPAAEASGGRQPPDTLDHQGADARRSPAPTADHHPAPDEGTIIGGRYKLLQQIGEGGMGTVWMADQLHPVRRKVAVKLVKEGMDSRRVLARFEAERQALALMDHPHIAKVLDAGTVESGPGAHAPGYALSPLRGSEVLSPGGATARSQGREPLGTFPGRPYFVMELVKGVPLTQFCDQHRLTVPQRLELFQQICSAVQHAHQKGVIHRDLKPTNVLVESHDGRPVPKVIDFGLAKAVSELPLTDKSLFTAFGAVMGTPQYMAPEQASFNAVDVDTRADIYALGVILYELLTGSPPIPKDRLRAAALDEVLRVIREEDPPTPSHRLSTAEGVPSVAANRQTEPKKLGRLVRGDLDWIVMKALAKDRNRRYETAVGFAADVGRFLADEPVLAGPPSAGYRLRKFVRRNRAVVLATAAVLLAVLTGAGVSAWQAIRATAAEKDARESAEAESVARQQADASRREAEETAEREKAGHRRAYETIRLLTYHIRLNLGNEAEPPEERMARLLSKVLPSELNADQFFVLVKFLDYYDASPTALGNSREALELRAAMHSHAAEIRASLHDDSDAVKDRRSALALWEQVAGDNPSDAKDRLALRDANVQLADALHRASQHQDAMTYWSKAATLTQTDDTDFRYRRAKGLSLAGRVDEASAEVDVVAGEGKADDYNAACVLARASAACGEGTQRREELASRAVERLRAGVAKGGGVMFTAPFLKLDPDFDSIRDRPDFQSVYAEAVAKQRRSKGLPELVPPPREVKR